MTTETTTVTTTVTGASQAHPLDGVEWSNPAFWRALAPSLHIEDMDFLSALQLFAVDKPTGDGLQALMRQEGYFQLPPVNWALPLEDLVTLVGRLDAAGIPVPFAFLFDEFWALFIKLHQLIEPILGPGYLRMPDFWVWFVDPRRDDSGWKPHRDKTSATLRADGSPTSLTVWLPLSDATTLNGCIYMVPADRDPTYNTAENGQWQFAHQDVRALPAQAGSILMWNQAVLHWGSHGSPRETRPRVSAAFEFQSCDVPPYNSPLMAPNSVPGFAGRLQLVGKQILQYQHMYPLDPAMKAIAERLSASGAPA